MAVVQICAEQPWDGHVECVQCRQKHTEKQD